MEGEDRRAEAAGDGCGAGGEMEEARMSNAHIHRMPRRLRRRHTLRVSLSADDRRFAEQTRLVAEELNNIHRAVMQNYERDYPRRRK